MAGPGGRTAAGSGPAKGAGGPQQSAALYRKVWTPGGSPLAVTSAAQAAALEQRLTSAHGGRFRVVVGMRYGQPSIASALRQLADASIDRILAFPMYPQYASATTGSSLEQLFRDVESLRVVPSIRIVPPYYDDARYIAALAAVARESLASAAERPEQLLLSFHGLPKRYADSGDPYPGQCHASAALLERELGFTDVATRVVFQSRFGREEWLQPYTDKTLEALGAERRRVAVMCPGFTADCLETLEEIRLRGYEQFHAAGGQSYHVIPCLNEHPAWLDAMAAIATRELGGWV